jgi:ParB/RepB/Spo0J family partition protein
MYIRENVRRTIITDSDDFAALVASIKAHGVMQNLTGEVDDHGSVSIISGQRRYLAAQAASVSKVYVRLCAVENRGDRAAQGLMENLLREELNIVDTADAFHTLIQEGWSIEKIALTFNRTIQTVRKYLQIADWPDIAKNQIRENLEVFTAFLLFNQIGKAEHEDHDLLLARLRNLLKQAREADAKREKGIGEEGKAEAISDRRKIDRESRLQRLIRAKAVVSQKPGKEQIRVTLTFQNEQTFEEFAERLAK